MTLFFLLVILVPCVGVVIAFCFGNRFRGRISFQWWSMVYTLYENREAFAACGISAQQAAESLRKLGELLVKAGCKYDDVRI